MAIFRKKLKKKNKRNTKTGPAEKTRKDPKQPAGAAAVPLKVVKKKKSKKKSKKQDKPPEHRSDFEANQVLIRDAMVSIMKEKKGRKPTNAELAEKTGLSEATIKRHVKDLEWKPQKSIWRVYSDDMFAALLAAAQKGSVRAVQLWFEVVEGWVRKTKQDIKHIGLDLDDSIDPEDAKSVYLSKLNPK